MFSSDAHKTLSKVLAEVSSYGELKDFLDLHISQTEQTLSEEFDTYEEPIEYINLHDYLETVKTFRQLLK
jgi:hypothetical protein